MQHKSINIKVANTSVKKEKGSIANLARAHWWGCSDPVSVLEHILGQYIDLVSDKPVCAYGVLAVVIVVCTASSSSIGGMCIIGFICSVV